MAEHAHTPPNPLPSITALGTPRAVVDFEAMVAVTDHRDADLLDLIERFTQLNDTSRALFHRAERLKEGGRASNRLWAEALDTNGERARLERAICTTKARTTLGAIAKGTLWLDLHSDNAGTMMDLPRAALTEMMAMLGSAGA